jgi:hypothetical protein
MVTCHGWVLWQDSLPLAPNASGFRHDGFCRKGVRIHPSAACHPSPFPVPRDVPAIFVARG